VAFRYCSKLSSIPLPDTVIDIASSSAFDGTAWYESQPEGMVYIGKNALCYKGKGGKGIPEGTSIEIKEGTLAISGNCFAHISTHNGLTSVTLPNSIIYIGKRAFLDCIKLQKVYSYIEDPKPIPDEVFVYTKQEYDSNGYGYSTFHQLNNVKETHFTLYVPKGTREKYLSTEGWIKARVIEEMDHDEIVVTANDKTRIYGDPNPSFDYIINQGEISGTPELKCDATEISSIGKYEIRITSGTITIPNVTYINGTLTITKAPLTITAKSYTIKQGDALPTFEAEYSGFKNNETASVLSAQPRITTSATSASAPGTYEIIVSGASATNYEISYVKGTLTISPVDVEPVTETETTTFSETVNENTNLSNTVIDNTYFNMNAANGDGYDATEQAIVLNSTTTESQMNTVENAEVGDAAIRQNFNGIIFEVAAGSGTITIDVKTKGTYVLNVQIGKGEPNKITKSERGTADVAYNVTAPTYIYLYASTASGNAAPHRAASANSVLLYGYKVTPGGTGIREISADNPVDVYNMQGNKVRSKATTLSGLPKGIYIVNGRKVIVK